MNPCRAGPGLPLPVSYVQALRRWTEQHDALLIFDEVQTGFGRTGRWFAFEHYGVQPDLICIAKGVTSGLPLAAVLGPAEILDVLAPGEIMTTHAAHPLSCTAALANLKVIEDEGLVEAAEEKGKLAREELRKLQARFREYISDVTGLGLLNAVHVQDPATRQPAARICLGLDLGRRPSWRDAFSHEPAHSQGVPPASDPGRCFGRGDSSFGRCT